jgi:hypothetical protein
LLIEPSLPSINNQQSAIENLSSIFRRCLVEHLRSRFGGRFDDLGNDPLHFAGFDLILRDAARLAGMGLDHGRGSALWLACTPRRHQNVSIVTVEPVHQLHGFSSPLNWTRGSGRV